MNRHQEAGGLQNIAQGLRAALRYMVQRGTNCTGIRGRMFIGIKLSFVEARRVCSSHEQTEGHIPAVAGMTVCSGPRSILVAHPRDHLRETAVDIGDLTGDAARQIRQQEGGGIAHVFQRDIAAQGRICFDEVEDLAEILDA